MEGADVRAAAEALLELDLSVADHGELSEAGSAVARLQSFVDLTKVRISRRGRELAELGDRSSDHVLLDEARLTGRDARTTGERDRVCEELPEFEAALAAGDCTGGHLDALARHTKGLSDDERGDLRDVVDDLLGSASNDPVGLFDRTATGIVDKIRAMHRPGCDAEVLDRQRQASSVKRWTDRGHRHEAHPPRARPDP